ncbi:MAG: hypothetical protein VXY94_03200 [Planctomycetota bacterium]|nr:hypothetical protein [Planctomycetota bacterium]MEC8733652.1 hypothetical protein [Planctomycetota bacterium]MEC9156516.1 hypothetical protein [Planctomycetota bacterium]MEC9232887.1 hypothetical protein [Planctomycetota bacterium]
MKNVRLMTGIGTLCLVAAGTTANAEILFTQGFEGEDYLGGKYFADNPEGILEGETFTLVNNAEQAAVNGEGFYATMTYTGGSGLSDGDFVGVTSFAGNVGSYTEGTQGYQISDSDGIFSLYLDGVAGATSVSLDYFVNSTGYEGLDFISISAGGVIGLDTVDQDIDDLEIEGEWRTITWTNLTSSEVVISVDFNSASEAIYIDNVQWSSTPIPAPGALALLGLAGLARRRRA